MNTKHGILFLTDWETGALLREPIKYDKAWIYTTLSKDSYGKPCMPQIVRIETEKGVYEISNANIEFEINGIRITGTHKRFNLFPNPKTDESRLTEHVIGISVYVSMNAEI